MTLFSQLVKLANKGDRNKILTKIIDKDNYSGILFDLDAMQNTKTKFL